MVQNFSVKIFPKYGAHGLRVIEPLYPDVSIFQYDRGGDQRPGQGAASGLVGTGQRSFTRQDPRGVEGVECDAIVQR